MLKQERIKDPKWLKFAEQMNCVVCGRSNTSMHHLRGLKYGSGTGFKAGDNFTLPLCENIIDNIGCHTKIHKSHKKFVEENKHIFNDDIEGFCQALYKKYKELSV